MPLNTNNFKRWIVVEVERKHKLRTYLMQETHKRVLSMTIVFCSCQEIYPDIKLKSKQTRPTNSLQPNGPGQVATELFFFLF